MHIFGVEPIRNLPIQSLNCWAHLIKLAVSRFFFASLFGFGDSKLTFDDLDGFNEAGGFAKQGPEFNCAQYVVGYSTN